MKTCKPVARACLGQWRALDVNCTAYSDNTARFVASLHPGYNLIVAPVLAYADVLVYPCIGSQKNCFSDSACRGSVRSKLGYLSLRCRKDFAWSSQRFLTMTLSIESIVSRNVPFKNTKMEIDAHPDL